MSAKDLVIGIDSSTTACKAIAWDHTGQNIAESRATYSTDSPRPNWYEQDAEDWWTALCATLHEVTAQVGSERNRRRVHHQPARNDCAGGQPAASPSAAPFSGTTNAAGRRWPNWTG